jgi:ATP-binding cassette subfamily B protein/subfamily B ATP-binding cassette protein MsbA
MSLSKVPVQLDDLPSKDFDPVVAKDLMVFVRPHTWPILAALFLMAVNAACSVAGPYLVKVALDSGLAANSFTVLRNSVLLYLLTAIIQYVSMYLRVNTMAVVGQTIIYDMRSRLFKHLQELSLSFFNHYSVGRIIVRVINDVNLLRDFIVWDMLAIPRDFFTLIFIVVTMLVMDARLSLLTFTVLPIMAVATVVFRKRAREYYRQTRTAISWVNSVLAENINAVRVVQSFSREMTNYLHFSDNVNHNNLDTNMKAIKLSSFFFPTIDFLGTVAMGLVIWLGGTAVLGQQITPGVLVAFIMYINRFFDPIRDLSQRYDTLQSTMASGERILALLAASIDVKDQPGAADLPPIRGNVRFEDVSFHYSDDPTPVLTGIDLDVPAGETVALVGKTGAGKTTIIKLLARFHDPTGGRVLVDGFDLRQVTQHSLRSQMGIVLQDPFLFSGTVRENIRFGRLEASDKEVENAAKAVGADAFIRNMRLGYETPVEEGGAILSVGQRQLLSFARALLADPRILILDEATSSVDTQTERVIQEALARLLKDRTAFVIAHRLSTIVNAGHIVVIQDGQMVEEGKHTDLLARGRVYYRMYSQRFEED